MNHLKSLCASAVLATALGTAYPALAEAQSGLSVNCGPGRTAVISQANGSVHVDCVGSGASTAAGPRNVAARRSVQTRYVEAPKKRSWQKGALMIGGSAGTGAGIGAIVGGKKGALIGAAIGGGSASIYEAAKRQ